MTVEKMLPTLIAIVTTAMGAATVVMVLAIAQMFGLSDRVDALYTDVGDIKASVAKVATATDFMREDLAEIKVALRGIDKKLASAEPMSAMQVGRFMVQDVPSFGAFLTTTPIMTGLSIGTESPRDAEMLYYLYQNWLSKGAAAMKAKEKKKKKESK